MTEQTFTLKINGHEYQVPSWAWAWNAAALEWAEQNNALLKIVLDQGPELWIRPGDEVQLVPDTPVHPEIPERLTQNAVEHLSERDDS
ncbi:MAG: hypothetical protein L0J20_10830, partial [Corynebacterium flavescens]|nr:hypothetical protein [Corynebacterium flavescens]